MKRNIDKFIKNLIGMFNARTPAVHIDSLTPENSIPLIQDAYKTFLKNYRKQISKKNVDENFNTYIWHPREGLTNDETGKIEAETKSISLVMDFIRKRIEADKDNIENDSGPTEDAFREDLFIILHPKIHLATGDPNHVLATEQLLKFIDVAYPGSCRVVLMGLMPDPMPPVIANLIVKEEFPFPDEEDITGFLRSSFPNFNNNEDVPIELVNAILGLDYRQARIAARRAATRSTNMEKAIEEALRAKIAALKSVVPFVEFWPPPKNEPPIVGMSKFVNYLNQIGDIMRNPDRKVSIGHGILMMGAPGTGKTTGVKMLSHILQFPVIKFSFSDLMQSLVGQSEDRMRRLLQVIRSFGKLIVMMDEVDKQMPDLGGSASDGGLRASMMATLLSEIQEVFDDDLDIIFYATANRPGTLPPEFFSRFRAFGGDDLPITVISSAFEAHLAYLANELDDEFEPDSYDFNLLAKKLEEAMQKSDRQAVPRDVVILLRESRWRAEANNRSIPTEDDISKEIDVLLNGVLVGNTVIARSIWDEAEPKKAKRSNGASEQSVVIVDDTENKKPENLL